MPPAPVRLFWEQKVQEGDCLSEHAIAKNADDVTGIPEEIDPNAVCQPGGGDMAVIAPDFPENPGEG